MKRTTQAHVDLAQRLLVHAAPGGTAQAAAAVYGTLFHRLAPLIGAAGVQAVFSRSVKLTRAEFSCLGNIDVAAESAIDVARSQEQLVAGLSAVAPQDASNAAAALYGTMLRLLDVLLGEQLAWQLVRSAFPALEQNASKEKL